jgi:hypothetical protein
LRWSPDDAAFSHGGGNSRVPLEQHVGHCLRGHAMKKKAQNVEEAVIAKNAETAESEEAGKEGKAERKERRVRRGSGGTWKSEQTVASKVGRFLGKKE